MTVINPPPPAPDAGADKAVGKLASEKKPGEAHVWRFFAIWPVAEVGPS